MVSPADAPESLVVRLYDAVFGRAADIEGLAFWTGTLRGGASLGALADAFVASPEFQARHGGLEDDGFVDLLYRKALDREADEEERGFWTGGLERGVSDRGDIAASVSESPEHVAKLALPNIDPLA